MMTMELHCPVCHHLSGNTITCDWPEPVEARRYANLICRECGRDFHFQVDASGMRAWTHNRGSELGDFLERRRRRGARAGP